MELPHGHILDGSVSSPDSLWFIFHLHVSEQPNDKKTPDMKAIFILMGQVSSKFLHLLLESNHLTEPVLKRNVLCNAGKQQEVGSCMCTFLGTIQTLAHGRRMEEGDQTL